MEKINKQFLEKLIEENKDINEISEIIGRTKGSTYNLLTKFRLRCKKNNKVSSADKYKDEIIHLYEEEDRTAKEISEKLNISSDIIWTSLKKWKIKSKSKGERSKVTFTEHEYDNLEKFIKNGDSINVVCEKMGYSKDVIYSRAREKGWNFSGKNKLYQQGECTFCRKPIDRNSSHQLFCSEKCKVNHYLLDKYGKYEFKCKQCGKDIELTYENIHIDFCSKKCAGLFNNRIKKERYGGF